MMARKQDVDWSDWKGYIEKPESPLSKPLNASLKKGADLFKDPDVAFGNLPVMVEVKPQPTNEQLFGHLVVSPEELKKKEEEWNNTFHTHFSKLNKPIDHLNTSQVAERNWGTGKSFNSMLTEEELEERNKFIGE
jgi:hypothetical protein